MTPGRQTTLTVRTPEGVAFSLRIAGPVTRFFAWFIDLMIVCITIIASSIVLGIFGIVAGGVASFLVYIILLLVPVCYGMLFEWLWRGQTIGKKIIKLRVIDETGLALTGGQIVVRNLLRAIDSLPVFYFIGGLFAVFSKRCQRLGDIAAGTVVVREVKEQVPDVEGILKDKYNSFRDHPHLEGRLRQKVSPEEAQVALGALLRRDSLDPDDRLQLYGELADHFREEVVFPEVTTDGLTDEQYVRNVVDTLFRRRRE